MAAIDEVTRTPDSPDPEPIRPGPGLSGVPIAMVRRAWRWLTSMRTALILLFLLALAAIPGSVLPQRNLNVDKVRAYYTAHPTLAPLLDRVGAFAVFSSPWFSAIYLLLFVSLVGCLVPRLRAHLVAVVRTPPDAPARLHRLPAHVEDLELAGTPAEVAERLRVMLRRRRYRTVVREQADGGYTVSAEKGHLKESGNLLFHFALLALLLGVAFGSWYGYHADRLVVQGTDQGFCNTLQQYDGYGLGARVNPATLEPFCLTLDGFQAKYLDNGQPLAYSAAVTYTVGSGSAQHTTIKVNDPLRLSKARVYLIGHGYAPVLRYTDRYGHTQTTVTPFLPEDSMLTSSGVVAFPDANVNPTTGRDPNNKQQVAFAGLYLPTAPDSVAVGHSASPAEKKPALMLTTYRGDLGMDAGIPQSVYSLDQHQIDTGRLKKVGDKIKLSPGQTATLDDGTTLQFVGTVPWATMSVRYDPGERVVLVGAICLLLGLLVSLTGRRRRVWFRVPPTGPVTSGALARSEYPSFGAEFDNLWNDVRTEGQP